MSHSSLEDFYQLMFALEHHHNYRTEQVENWIVFERDIKVDMLQQFMEYKKQMEDALAKG